MDAQLERINSRSRQAAQYISNGIKQLNDPFFLPYLRMKTNDIGSDQDSTDVSKSRTMRELTETTFEYNPLLNGKDFVLSVIQDSTSSNVTFDDLALRKIDTSFSEVKNPYDKRMTVNVTAPQRITIPGYDIDSGTLYGLNRVGGNRQFKTIAANQKAIRDEDFQTLQEGLRNVRENQATLSDVRKKYYDDVVSGKNYIDVRNKALNNVYTDALGYYLDPYEYFG